MADINLNRPLTINPENVSSVKNSPVTPAAKQEQTAKPKAEVPGLENVIYTSEDGDTVQVKPEANERLSDGFVFNKTDRTQKEETIDIAVNEKEDKGLIKEEKENAVKEAEKSAAEIEERREEKVEEMIKASQEESDKRKEAAKEALAKEADDKAADKALDNKVNFAGVSDSELERMYLTGRISSYDYNSEMASRKENEEANNKEGSDLSKAAGEVQAGLEKNKILEDAIEADKKGTGYTTREEEEAVKQALFGTDKDDNSEGKGFEINIIR